MYLKKKLLHDEILVRRGTVSNDMDGTPLFINDKCEGYRVNDTAVSLWNMCNGITFEELKEEVLRISNDDEENVSLALGEMIEQLKRVSVLDTKPVKRDTFMVR
ncbi:MAG TPA: PqqD family peptide modification chaperone [Nitrososphaeraceae archaeon]